MMKLLARHAIIVLVFSPICCAQTPRPWVFAFSQTIGSEGHGSGQFYGISGITVDRNGCIYTADRGNCRVCKFDGRGQLLLTIEKCSIGVAVDSGGNIYSSDPMDGEIMKLSPAGTLVATWPSASSDLAIDLTGNIYVRREGSVLKLDGRGNVLAEWGDLGLNPRPYELRLDGITVDQRGGVYVSDASSNQVHKFSSSGRLLRSWGRLGSEDGCFRQPQGMGVDASGNVYVADTGNGRVQVFDTDGRFLAKLGSSGQGPGQFMLPLDVAVDGAGNVYVADGGRIQRFARAAAPSGAAQPDMAAAPPVLEHCLLTIDRARVYKETSPMAYSAVPLVEWKLLYTRESNEGCIAVSPDGRLIADNGYVSPIKNDSFAIVSSEGALLKTILVREKLQGAGKLEEPPTAIVSWIDWTGDPDVLVLGLEVLTRRVHGEVIATYSIQNDRLVVISPECAGKDVGEWPGETSDALLYQWPAVSPRGDLIAYRYGNDICVAQYPSMSNRRVITAKVETVDTAGGACKLSAPIRWRPDGTSVAVLIGGDVFIITNDGSYSASYCYDDHKGREVWLSWSPDGEYLLWPDNRGDNVMVQVLYVSPGLSISRSGMYSIGPSESTFGEGRGRLLWAQMPVPPRGPSKVTVTSMPAGMKIYIDGRLSGEIAPHTFELEPGNHRIGVQPLVGKLQDREVIVEAGKDIKVEFVQ